MSMPGRSIRRFIRATAVAAGLVVAGCGSTAPSGPSPVSVPPAQFPSLVGNWREDSSLLVLQARDVAGPPTTWGCQSELVIQQQTGGTFSGLAIIQGGNDKQCTWTFTFTADVAPDGTLTRFVPDNGSKFVTVDCKPVSEPAFSGMASGAGIKVAMRDRATCTNRFGQPIDVDRVLTMSVTSRSSLGST